MDRRQLLKWLGGAVVAAPLVAKAVPRDFSTPVMTYKCRELAPSKFLTSNTAWFLKTEHPDGLRRYAHPIRAKDFRRVVEPILNDIFEQTYSQHSSEWAAIFGPEQLTLF
jgi:hypothetical protein